MYTCVYIYIYVYTYIFLFFSEIKTPFFKSNHFVMVGSSRFHHRKILTNDYVAHDQRKYETLTNTKKEVTGRTWYMMNTIAGYTRERHRWAKTMNMYSRDSRSPGSVKRPTQRMSSRMDAQRLNWDQKLRLHKAWVAHDRHHMRTPAANWQQLQE